MDLGDDFASSWTVDDRVFAYPHPQQDDLAVDSQEQNSNLFWHASGRPSGAFVGQPAAAPDLSSFGQPVLQPEYDPRSSMQYSHHYLIASDVEAKRRKIDSVTSTHAQQLLPSRFTNSGFTSEHHFNPACPCHFCVERVTIMHQRSSNPHYSSAAESLPSPFLSPMNPTMSASGTPSSAANTPSMATPVSVPSSSSHRAKAPRISEDDEDSESEELSLTGKDDGALDDDDDEFNSDDAEMQPRRRGRKRSRTSSSSIVDPYLLPKSAPSQNPERLITIAPGIELTVGKLLNMSTAEIKDMKLTPEQEESLKKQRRLLRNRESAAMSRAKRRDLLSTLEARSQDLINKLKKLDSQIDEMKKSNQDLRAKVAVAKKTSRNGTDKKATSRPASSSTALSGTGVSRPNVAALSTEPRHVPLSAPATLHAAPLLAVKQESHLQHFSDAYAYHPQPHQTRGQRYGQAYYAPLAHDQLADAHAPMVAGGAAAVPISQYMPPMPLPSGGYSQEVPPTHRWPNPSRLAPSYPAEIYGNHAPHHFSASMPRGPAPPGPY